MRKSSIDGSFSIAILDCQRVSGATAFYSISFGTGIILANDTMIYSVCQRFSEVHHRHLLKPFTPFTRQCTQSSLFYHLGHAVALADSCTAVLFSPSVSASGYRARHLVRYSEKGNVAPSGSIPALEAATVCPRPTGGTHIFRENG